VFGGEPQPGEGGAAGCHQTRAVGPNRARERVGYGYRHIQVLLQREGWQINLTRTRRIYWALGLQLRNKTPMERAFASCISVAQVAAFSFRGFFGSLDIAGGVGVTCHQQSVHNNLLSQPN